MVKTMAGWKPWIIEISDFPTYTPPFGSGSFQPAMFEYQRVDFGGIHL